MEGFFDKARSAAEGVAAKAKEGVVDVQAKRERSQLITQLGNDALELLERGELDNPKLQATAAKIRQIDARDDVATSATASGSAGTEAPAPPAGSSAQETAGTSDDARTNGA